jgi:uncharacterized protein YgfB (UPF0149 family)
MSAQPPQTPDFDDLADLFWRLGVMQSPSQLQGFLAGQIAVAGAPDSGQWLRQASEFIDSVEPPNSDENRLLVALYQATSFQFSEGDIGFALLLPDDAVEITQRVDALSQWCRGFLTGFARGGKALQQHSGKRQYSEDVTEVLNDMAAISQVSLTEQDDQEAQRERDFFELCEYLRLGAITIHLECQQSEPAVASAGAAPAGETDAAIASPAGLFAGRSDAGKLH